MNLESILCFLQIVKRELTVFSKILKSRIIDLFIVVGTNVFVFAYIMPSLGTGSNYGIFIFLGLVPILSFFEVIPKATEFVSDITGAKKISYMLTLPLPSSMVFCAIAVGWSLSCSILTIFIFLIGKIFLLSKLDLTHLSIWKFLTIFITSNLFFGFFALWLVGMIKNLKYVSWVWTRVVNPMFMLGCYFYSWQTLWKRAPSIAYFDLLNPLIYTTEGIRNAFLGKEGTIPFIYCVAALWFFIGIFGMHGICRLKKRLDCV